MIEQLLSNKDSISYVIACACIVLALVVGYMFGYQDPNAVCAEYIVDAKRSEEKAVKLLQELTECKASKAGGAVIDCKSFCDEQTSKALKAYKKICED